MEPSDLEKLSKKELMTLVDSLLWQYRLVDAFWFINVENKYDLSSAEDMNANVWEKIGRLSAKDIKKKFNIKTKGLKGFLKVMEFYPWKMMDCFQIKEKKDELIVTSSNCPAQTGRIKHGLSEYVCKEMHYQEFKTFAEEIDPEIKIECIFAPPDPHPQDLFCKWRIYT
jgi:Family of unknown function (DUF6125)